MRWARRPRRIPPVALLLTCALLTGCTAGESSGSGPPSAIHFALTVQGGAGDGLYPEGTLASIVADGPPNGSAFDRWTGDTGGIADVFGSNTSLTMPAMPVKVTAQFKPAPTHAKWSKVELDLSGPASVGMSSFANPFEIVVDVTFLGPGGTFVVPAFYAGDGQGGLDGDLWRVRFSPNDVGAWTWVSSSPDARLDGQTGSFQVVAVTGVAAGFDKLGRVRGVAEHYLKYEDGDYWLKGGAGDPEDFLANPRLPTRQDKLQAIDFLAAHGINSLYLMPMNVLGDSRNVWPWVGGTESDAQANHKHFDIAKLAEWETIFEHMQRQGILIHMVLEDDSGWVGFDRDLYYRHLVAHFGHHNGLIWNISEEFNENYSVSQARGFAKTLRDLDPYDHPIAIHHAGPISVLDPFFDDPNFDITSFQTSDVQQNDNTVQAFRQARNAGHTLAISFDETGKIDPSERDKAREIAWSVYLGGGNFELHTSPIYSGTNTYADYADHFDDLARARRFVEEHLPFWDMEPRNDLLSPGSDGYLFAKEGAVYAAYTPGGNTISIDLSAASGSYRARWFDPRSGGFTDAGTVGGGAVWTFGPPGTGDVALLLERQ